MRQLVGVDALAALRAEKDDLAVHGHFGHVGDVGHEHIHADAADDGRAPAAHQQVGAVAEYARVAVAIANGHGHDARAARGGECAAIADRLPRLDPGDAHGPGRKALRHLQAGHFAHAVAVKGNAGAHGVVAQIGIADARGGRVVDDGSEAGAVYARDGALEGGVLSAGEVLLRVGHGEVGEHALHLHVGAVAPARKQLVQLHVAARADAGHAGIHLEVGAGGSAFRDGGGFQTRKGVRREHRRGDARAHGLALIAGGDAAENEDGAHNARFAQGKRLFQNGDGEHIRARGLEASGDGNGAVAIGVGLDHGDHLDARRQRRANPAVVFLDGGKGNGQTGASHSASTSACESTRTPLSAKTLTPRSCSERRRMISALFSRPRTKE